MKNKKILLLGSSVLALPLTIMPIVSCSEVEEEYMEACNSELGFFFNNRGCIFGYEGPNLDETWNDQKVVTVPEYLEVTSPISSPILGRKYKITEINKQGGNVNDEINTQLWGGTNLEEIKLPDSIKIIGFGTFPGSKLSKINWPKNLTHIFDNAFAGTLLSEIVFPSSLAYIGPNAFKDIQTLTSIKFPNSLKSIGLRAFLDCSQLGGELDFTKATSLMYIDAEAFWNTNITKVILPKGTRYVRNDNNRSDSFPTGCIIEGGIPTTHRDIEVNQDNWGS